MRRRMVLFAALVLGAHARAQELQEAPPVVERVPVLVSRVEWERGDEVLQRRSIRGKAELTFKKEGAPATTMTLGREGEERRRLKVGAVTAGAVTSMQVSRDGWTTMTLGEARSRRVPIGPDHTLVSVIDGRLALVDDEDEPIEEPSLVAEIAGTVAPPLLASLADAVPGDARIVPGQELEVPPALAQSTLAALGSGLVANVERDRGDAARFPSRRLIALGAALVDGVRCAAFSVDLVRTRTDRPGASLTAKGTLWVDVATGRPARLDVKLVAVAEGDPTDGGRTQARADAEVHLMDRFGRGSW